MTNQPETYRAKLNGQIAALIGEQWNLDTLVQQERLLGHHDLACRYAADRNSAAMRQRLLERELADLCEVEGCCYPAVASCGACNGQRCEIHGRQIPDVEFQCYHPDADPWSEPCALLRRHGAFDLFVYADACWIAVECEPPYSQRAVAEMLIECERGTTAQQVIEYLDAARAREREQAYQR